jgi:Acetoacetate decarboxylase (ADC)
MKVKQFPAPWNLTGKAFLFLYNYNEKFLLENGFLEKFQADNLVSKLGMVMIVRYESSDCGPYDELLFIPGKIEIGSETAYSISKIYVSTNESVENGIENWAIPKEQAHFEWVEEGRNTEINISKNGVNFFSVKLKSTLLKFPVTTKILPIKVMQIKDNQLFVTKPSANGWTGFAKLMEISVNTEYFPGISFCKPILVANMSKFRMIFPKSKTKNI